MGRIVRSVRRLGDPVMFMGAWGTALLIALFVLYPVFRVLAYPSATDFLAVLDHPRWLRAIVNTLVMTTLSTVTACLLGFVFALALTRPDLPGKGLFRTISYAVFCLKKKSTAEAGFADLPILCMPD